MKELSWRTRRQSLKNFSEVLFDLLIVGGGITGAGIALDASVRGFRVALVEKRDFASGTSSRSTKLIHGGLRYLEHFDFNLVREALIERSILARTAPHLAQPFPFLIPIYRNSQKNYDRPLKMRAGLALYDLLAGRRGFGRHRHLSRQEALMLAPQLDSRGLNGAFLYFDALTDDSRLVIEVIKAAHELGASVANYARVANLIKNEDGYISGARLRDELSGFEVEMRARIVINATGVWMEDTIELSGQNEARFSKSVRPSKGIHLTVSADRLKVNSACLIPSMKDHRFYFVVPWHGRVNVGTTDIDYQGDKDSPHAERHEINEILGAINSYFPSAQIEPSDVISSWAGLRPLISDSNAKYPTEISRREEILETSDGLISISGGKLTTYRRMAERTMDLAAQRLHERFQIDSGGLRTKDVAVSGGKLTRQELAEAAQRLVENENLTAETAEHLVHSYGSNYHQLIKLMREDEDLRKPLVEGLPQLCAEIVYATRYEMASTLADALARRTRLAILAGDESMKCAPVTAALMARELGWSNDEVNFQISQFLSELEREYSPVGSLRVGESGSWGVRELGSQES
jgi:glycerol-3-phosphate dehydrogenase